MHAITRTALALSALALAAGCGLAEKNAAFAERQAERTEERAAQAVEEQRARAEVQREFDRTRPRCISESTCDAMWRAVQVWVSRNAGMRLQIATDAILETYAPEPSGARLAARVVREPDGPFGSVLTVSVWCGNPFGCMTEPNAAALDFNRYVSAAAPI